MKPSKSPLPRIIGASDAVHNEVTDLHSIFEPIIDRLVHDLRKMHIYKDKMKDLLKQAEIDIQTVPKMNGKVVMSSMLGVKYIDKITIKNLCRSKTKGFGCFSRMKPKAEVSDGELWKRRACGVCREKGGHNYRTCKLVLLESKKPKK